MISDTQHLHHHQQVLPSSSKAPSKKKIKEDGIVMKRAPGAPKRFKSSYILFFVNVQESIKQSLPRGKSSAPAVSKIASQMWKNLSTEDRAYWDRESLKDKKRYDSEKLAYTGPWEVPKKRVKKDKNAPRRNPSAFLLFSKIRRRQLREENPHMKNTEVSIMLGNEWRNASHAVKLPFIRQEEQEREVYKEQMGKWKTQKEMEQTMTHAISDQMQKEMQKKIVDVLLSQMPSVANNQVSSSLSSSSSTSAAAAAAATASMSDTISPLLMKQYIAALDNIRNIVTPQANASATAAAATSMEPKCTTPPPTSTTVHNELNSNTSTPRTKKQHNIANDSQGFNTPTTYRGNNDDSNNRYNMDMTMRQGHSNGHVNPNPMTDPFGTFASENIDFMGNLSNNGGVGGNAAVGGDGSSQVPEPFFTNNNTTYNPNFETNQHKPNFVTPTRTNEFDNMFEDNYLSHQPKTKSPHNPPIEAQVDSNGRKPQPYRQDDPRIIAAVKSYQNSLLESGETYSATNNTNIHVNNNSNNNNSINKINPTKQDKYSHASAMYTDFSFEPAPFDVSDCFHNFDGDDSTVDFLPTVLDYGYSMDNMELDQTQFDEFDPMGDNMKTKV